ncbi:endonuclease/exonuclease/phosphatase family protein [Myceligenerans pegani]|uniref:Endonuclease/exonuclease/phosphatase family protein n=1 Tax=Myceligenerans pegani TaxID=2776917 RepID=A0ABR9MSP1_9MICO|nr:endonuclease/exonuclease/phosphatase family protein [Myceligenerans sp. TRM 65318]MBE1874397.1 endonuclease/exonuclease/phosphatase family protein [Myceligenerans sp. TRM 65318]MBE3016668.1 endonuclease/exonuclease/phosphatase family protein [Myceligenerans sp. TRM 65318]
MTHHSDAYAPPAFPEPRRPGYGGPGDRNRDGEEYDGDRRDGPGRGQRIVTWLVWLCAIPVLAVLGSRALPDDGITPVAQLVPFFPYAVLVAVPLLVLAVMGRRYVLAVVLVVCVTLGGYVVASAFIPGERQAFAADPRDAGTLRVMTVNVLYGSANAEWIVETVRAEGVEILAVQELTPEFGEALADAGLGELLPHQVTGKVETGSPAGSGLYSALELTEQEGGESSTFAMPSAVVDAGGLDVRIRNIHPVPPMPGNIATWKRELREIRQVARSDTMAQIMLGDFNATHDHASFRDVLGDRFRDAWRETGAGLERTWPEGKTLPVLDTQIPALIAVDHVVVESSMGVADVRSRIVPGADHRAVLSTIVVR